VRGRITPATYSRRELLRMGGALGAGLALTACTGGRMARTSRPTAHDPRVVVVGAGLAGLTAAYRVTQAGVPVRLFEARDRVGGRCWTARGFADGQTAEHGGEFIDTRHVHLLGLADELGLEVDDLWEAWVPGSIWPTWLDGAPVPWKEVQAQLDPVAAAVEREACRIGVIADGRKPSTRAISYGTATPEAVELDARSMAEWLDERVPGVVGSPLGAYLDASMSGWYGLEMDRLSACTWMDYFVLPAPGADERWHVRGGNDLVTDALAERLPAGTVELEAPFEVLRARSDGSYELRFGGAAPVVADLVVLALPFSTLRFVDLDDAAFGPERLAAIRGLGMGSDVKLLVQYDRRPSAFEVDGRTWSGGMDHTDPHFQTWESSAGETGRSGLLTVYAGGRTGESWTSDEPHAPAPPAFAAEYVGHVDDVVPGTAERFNGRAWLDLWTRDPWTNGAYAAFLPGQYTRLWGYTGRAEGRVHFAGEHTSTYSQGYLNGGVESGQRVAIEVMRELGRPVPASIADLPHSAV
jgi:monoamine oxidase